MYIFLNSHKLIQKSAFPSNKKEFLCNLLVLRVFNLGLVSVIIVRASRNLEILSPMDEYDFLIKWAYMPAKSVGTGLVSELSYRKQRHALQC